MNRAQAERCEQRQPKVAEFGNSSTETEWILRKSILLVQLEWSVEKTTSWAQEGICKPVNNSPSCRQLPKGQLRVFNNSQMRRKWMHKQGKIFPSAFVCSREELETTDISINKRLCKQWFTSNTDYFIDLQERGLIWVQYKMPE